VLRVLSEPYAGLWEGFLEYERRRRSVSGFETLKTVSYQLMKRLEQLDLRPKEVTIQDALEYKAYVAGIITKEGKEITAGTCCNHIKAARAFFRYLVTSGKRESNPFYGVSFPRRPERINRNVLSEAQMNSLLERLREFTEVPGYKAHVIAELLYAAGLRINEAAGLLPADIDTRQRLVYVREGKGGRSRTAFLTGYACEVLEHYIKSGRELVVSTYYGQRPQGHTLFCVGTRRLMEEITDALRKACKELELPLITSHGFRHSVGTHLLRSGCDMRHIQVILGHEHLRTTQVYTQVDKDDVKASLDAHHPRRWKKEGER
jgi:integrase/recombinase XerC